MTDDTRPELPNGTYLTPEDRQAAARDAYRESVLAGTPLRPADLASMFDRRRRWADLRIAEVRSELNGTDPKSEDDEDMSGHESATPPVVSVPTSTSVPPMAVTPAIRRVTTAAVLVVAAVAAGASYDHQRQLAALAGEGWRAWLLPFSVDGLIVAASMSMLVRRRLGQTASPLAWIAFLLGGLASVAANVAAADPTLLGRLVAAWPPIALLVSYELLLQQVRTPASVPAVRPPAVSGMDSVAA